LLPRKLATTLTMTLTLGMLPAVAQMVPVAGLPAPEEPSAAYTSASTLSLTPAALSPNLSAAIGGVQLPPPALRHHDLHIGPFSTVALGFTAGTLGPGLELAVPLARSLNLRVGGTYFNLQYPFTIDGVNYDAGMKLTSGQAMMDWYPKHRGFHVSAGALYFKSMVDAAAGVAPGQRFKLGGTTYLNSVDDPVGGTASLSFPRKLAPMVLLGFGNLIPRSGRHISVPFEIGGAYLAPPQINLQLAGTACTDQGCFNTATDPTTQTNLTQEREKLNTDIRLLKIYPVVSLGFALRF
jgi:hypothetical protein